MEYKATFEAQKGLKSVPTISELTVDVKLVLSMMGCFSKKNLLGGGGIKLQNFGPGV